VVNGFVGTALRGSKSTPQTKIFGHHWGGRPRPVGGWNRPLDEDDLPSGGRKL